MNRINQPEDVKSALPNLSQIIAMRAVGVWEQVNQTGATVCGAGCDLSTLGNANRGRSSYTGLLSVVDARTGIFVTSDYGDAKEEHIAEAPVLKVESLETEQAIYQDVVSVLKADEDDLLTVYRMDTGAEPVSEYTLKLPLSAKYMETEAETKFYSYDGNGGVLTELITVAQDNLYIGNTSMLCCMKSVEIQVIAWLLLEFLWLLEELLLDL